MHPQPSNNDAMAGAALITGATAGLGHRFAEKLADEGYPLILVARNAERLAATAEALHRQYGVEVEIIPADLTVATQRAGVEQRLADGARPVEVLVNNAGFGLKQRFTTGDVEAEQAMLDILVTAPMRLTHAVVPGMVSRRRGRIINISSVAGWITAGTYSAAKAWVTNFTEGLASELHGTGVTATVVCPGFTRTEFHDRSGISSSRIPDFMWLSAEQVVDKAWSDATKGHVVSVAGIQYEVMSTLAQYAPRPIVRRASTLRKR